MCGIFPGENEKSIFNKALTLENVLFDIEKLKQGDENAFKLFFECLYPKLMGIACRFVDQETAQDLVQEIFVELWEKRHILQAANLHSFLYKWIQNKCLDNLRHRQVQEDYASYIRIAEARFLFSAHTTDTNEVFKQVSAHDLREHIEQVVTKLPPKCQEAFRLSYFYEMPHKEIAQIMQVSIRTVEGHIRAALLVLRKDLQDILKW